MTHIDRRPRFSDIDSSNVELETEVYNDEIDILDASDVTRELKPRPWGKLFFSGLLGMILLAVGLWADNLVQDMFARNDWLGWVGVAVISIAALGAVGFVVREILAIKRLSRIEHLREAGEAAFIRDDTTKSTICYCRSDSALYQQT
jgi:uncharacterized membrane protein YcjF (UPF0283 family)